MNDVLRIANCSGFYGDRLLAAREMVEGGPIDVLTGDYLAELTMSILWRSKQRDPEKGYASTFVTQMEQVLGTCLDRGIKIVSNAGGINPAGLAERLAKLAADLGISPRIAYIEGDDLLARLEGLEGQGHRFVNMDTGMPLTGSGVTPLTANAYLGGWGISEALAAGADVIITGRVTDAALVVGPAAWNFGWRRDDWDSLAGAVVAGHIIECGAQCTGGNYSFFEDVPGLERVGFPIAEIHSDGSCVITKHPGTGGLVSVGTVTAQLLYEIGSPHYLNPDVTSLFESITLTEVGPDRVQVTGVRGEPPPPDLKVAMNYLGGHKNSMTFGIAAPNVAKKAEALVQALWEAAGPPAQFAAVDVDLIGAETENPRTNDDALAYLRISVKDPDPDRVGRRFSSAAVELALSSYPGFFLTTPPGEATAYAVYWPTTVPASLVPMRVVMDAKEWVVSSVAPQTEDGRRKTEAPEPSPHLTLQERSTQDAPLTTVPLGSIAGARSGDKGGNANVGFWVRNPGEYRWLADYLTVERIRILMPEAAALVIDRYELPNLLAVNFVLHGLLGEGVSSSTRTDPQAKSLGEFLRACWVEVPKDLVRVDK
ncbi:MAG TPA: acyclic terpene utilization AtuA family protein [Acidimicrobiia bacterium]|nr:acyclic terpene utilization AtuA family protein [Acidimicrobiia bacterium]